MKLIFCPQCRDIVKLKIRQHRICWCGASGGEYIDSLNVVIDGDAIPLGFNNRSFDKALASQPEKGEGKKFNAFVIPKDCPTVSRK